jgi:hypothetical protein
MCCLVMSHYIQLIHDESTRRSRNLRAGIDNSEMVHVFFHVINYFLNVTSKIRLNLLDTGSKILSETDAPVNQEIFFLRLFALKTATLALVKAFCLIDSGRAAAPAWAHHHRVCVSERGIAPTR